MGTPIDKYLENVSTKSGVAMKNRTLNGGLLVFVGLLGGYVLGQANDSKPLAHYEYCQENKAVPVGWQFSGNGVWTDANGKFIGYAQAEDACILVPNN